MNYFAHAMRFLDDPHFAAGTGVPDWLCVVDRKVRVRRRHLTAGLEGVGPDEAALLRGIGQHLDDDARFHATRAFVELSMAIAVSTRDVLKETDGFRPAFLGHLLVEMLLDASLIADCPTRLEEYYRLLDGTDAAWVENAVNRVVEKSTDRLAWMIRAFCRERILWDYLDDGKLLRRLNQIMRRVRLAELPESFIELLPSARRLVDCRKAELFPAPNLATPGETDHAFWNESVDVDRHPIRADAPGAR